MGTKQIYLISNTKAKLQTSKYLNIFFIFNTKRARSVKAREAYFNKKISTCITSKSHNKKYTLPKKNNKQHVHVHGLIHNNNYIALYY